MVDRANTQTAQHAPLVKNHTQNASMMPKKASKSGRAYAASTKSFFESATRRTSCLNSFGSAPRLDPRKSTAAYEPANTAATLEACSVTSDIRSLIGTTCSDSDSNSIIPSRKQASDHHPRNRCRALTLPLHGWEAIRCNSRTYDSFLVRDWATSSRSCVRDVDQVMLSCPVPRWACSIPDFAARESLP